jgi:S-(hydroxymethyl)glutathione dehydrogenase/alcohol dehydrogenase
MKTKAAIAWKAGAPSRLEEVDLEAPRAGEGLLDLMKKGESIRSVVLF